VAAIDAYVGWQPRKVVWNVVRGDDSTIEVVLLDRDGAALNTSGWTYVSKARLGSVLYDLVVMPNSHIVTVKAPAATTALWGAGSNKVPAAKLSFDLQVTMGGGTVWTPLVGTVIVTPDVS